MADTATLEANLAEAEAALHKLMTGVQEVEVSYEGHDVKYTAASEPRLRRYIRSLKSQLGQTDGRSSSRGVAF